MACKDCEELRLELKLLKRGMANNKENLVNSLHKKLGLLEDVEKNRFLTYGHFLWKLNMEELVYLDEILS